EKRINQLFDYSVFVSRDEADLFSMLYPEAENLSVIPNGVDHEYFHPSKAFGDQYAVSEIQHPALLFTGAMDYHANVDGVIWFCKEILPLIKKEIPEVRFYIVGSNPSPKVQALSTDDGVEVTGFVEDIRPYYQEADLCVIPLRLARGVQNKVLEAMAMEKPVVTTKKALYGIRATPEEHTLVADDPLTFASLVLGLLRDGSRARQLGHHAREFVRDNYDWPSNIKKLEEILLSRDNHNNPVNPVQNLGG
ncbi:MAG: glycosyltransferase, partial [Candidatus Hodarchaeota archaeon]